MRFIHATLLLAALTPGAALALDNSGSAAYCIMKKSHFAEALKIQVSRAASSAGKMPPVASKILASDNDSLNNAASVILERRISASDSAYICNFYSSPFGRKLADLQLRKLQTGRREFLTGPEHDLYMEFVTSDAYRNWNKLDFKGRSYLEEFMQELEK